MSHPPPDPPEESALPLSESSMLERLEQDLREGAPLQATPESDPDSVAADTLIRLNNTFCRPQQPPLTHIDRFEIRRELGRGQFGVVYLAWDPKLKREVAVKVAGVRVLLDDGLRQRFERETQLTARLNHPGLVRVHEVGECEGTPFYVMPVAEGISLREWLNQRAEPMVLSEAVQLVIDVADALHHGHELGIIHRDIKPANIMIRPVSNDDVRKWQVCVLDFGLATLADPRLRETEGGMLLGTPMYMSPEQAEGRRDDVSAASDQFSLGCLLYELITGRAVFQADHLPQVSELFKRCDPPPPSSLRGDCDVELDAVCLKCLLRDSGDRYASMSDLADDLRMVQNGEISHALQERKSWQAAAHRLKTRRRIGQGLLLSAMIGCVAYFSVQHNHTDSNGSSAQKDFDPDVVTELAASQNPASIEGDRVSLIAEKAAGKSSDQLNRRLAEFVTTHGGSVEVRTSERHFELESPDDLPGVPYDLLWIMMPENKHATDELIAQLRDLKSLEGVDLYATPVTDAAAEHLAAIPTLANVYLHETAITDVGATIALSLPLLEELNLSHTAITDATLQACGRHSNLQLLNVGGTDITDIGFRELIKAPSLVKLDVSFTNVTDAAFSELSERTDLIEICIAGTGVTSQHFEIVMQQEKLRYLECSPDFFGELSLREFRKQRPLCEVRLR